MMMHMERNQNGQLFIHRVILKNKHVNNFKVQIEHKTLNFLKGEEQVYKEIILFLNIENYSFHLVLLFCSSNQFQVISFTFFFFQHYLFLIHLKNNLVYLYPGFLGKSQNRILLLSIVSSTQVEVLSNVILAINSKTTNKCWIVGRWYLFLSQR